MRRSCGRNIGFMRVDKKAPQRSESPLLVMAIVDGFFGRSGQTCVFATVQLQPAVVVALRAMSEISRDAGGTELLVGHWPVIWDGDLLLRIERTVWHVAGKRHWAEAFGHDLRSMGCTVELDVRELAMFGDAAVVWHATPDSDLSVEDMLGQSFIEIAWGRLVAQGLVPPCSEPGPSHADLRRLLLDLEQ